VAAVLGDALRRISVLGGRDGMPRSLGSVYAGSVTRFLGGGFRGVVSRVVTTPGVKSFCNGVAVSVDGSALLVCDGATRMHSAPSHAIHEFSLEDGSLRRVVGEHGVGQLQFRSPWQVCVARDGFVFVADRGNGRVQVLTPSLDFHAFVGAERLDRPGGVCASDDAIVVSEWGAHRVTVFNRRDDTLLRRFGTQGKGDGELCRPCGVCLMHGDRHVAVAECDKCRVSVFSVDGDFIRHVGVGTLKRPLGVACSSFDELVVADTGHGRVVVYSASGVVTRSVSLDGFVGGVAVRGGTIVTHTAQGDECYTVLV
jgi:hypothetical protein